MKLSNQATRLKLGRERSIAGYSEIDIHVLALPNLNISAGEISHPCSFNLVAQITSRSSESRSEKNELSFAKYIEYAMSC